MYKPHTIEQYKVYRFLEENFALEHFLLAPLSRFGLMLEDKTGEKLAFAFLNDCVQEIPIPAPAAPETVIAFLKQFRSLTPVSYTHLDVYKRQEQFRHHQHPWRWYRLV